MRELMGRIARIAPEEIPVLFWGEHGAGKDLLARTLHAESPRRDGPFVSEVCTVSESLLESELFGYVRGAFTDAVQDRPGLLQMGAGGTLYLDEIGEMSPALQARLLRVIEERRARPIGAEASVPIDLRLVSSTCRAPAGLERSGVLRPDLFYRIRGEVLWVPPLRDRREDIPHLARLFAAECARERGLPPPTLAPGLLPELSRRDWPGNVRQLENEVRRAYLLNPSRLTLEAFRPLESDGAPAREGNEAGPVAATLAGKRTYRLARAEFERQLIAEALRQHGGNASHAARALRITRRYLGILLEKHGIRLSEYGAVRPGPAPRKPRRAR
jgi:DNA-binding NtrC family response regulator